MLVLCLLAFVLVMSCPVCNGSGRLAPPHTATSVYCARRISIGAWCSYRMGHP